MFNNLFRIFSLIWLIVTLLACSQDEQNVYLFSYFTGNGEDGLHLASSKDAYTWTALNDNKSVLDPTAGKDKLMRDPCVIKGGDGLFHMVWTVSWNEQGIGYANSPDLINWSDQKFIPVMTHLPRTRNCWAPEIFYDDEEGTYLIMWASTVPGKFTETDSLSEDAYNHRMYYTTTKDFNSFTDTELFYDDGFNVIDASIIKENGEYIMLLKNETLLPQAEKNIRIAKSNNLRGPYSPASQPITDNWVEGPTILKLADQFIVYFDRYRDHKMGAIRSSDLENWTDISDEISFPEGTRHGTVFKVGEEVYKNLLSEVGN